MVSRSTSAQGNDSNALASRPPSSRSWSLHSSRLVTVFSRKNAGGSRLAVSSHAGPRHRPRRTPPGADVPALPRRNSRRQSPRFVLFPQRFCANDGNALAQRVAAHCFEGSPAAGRVGIWFESRFLGHRKLRLNVGWMQVVAPGVEALRLPKRQTFRTALVPPSRAEHR